MHVHDLERLYDYNYWANAKLLAAAAQLSSQQFTDAVAGGHGSIRNTIVHMLSAEWGWLDRCGGPPRGERLKPEDYPTLESVVDKWQFVETNMRAFLAKVTDEDVSRRIEFSIGSGAKHSATVGDLIEHGAIHAIHHRAQIAMLLRMLGHAPGTFDFVLYALEQPTTV